MRHLRRLALAMVVAAWASSAAAAGVGDIAPPFTVTTFDKRKISSADLKGKVVILDYWATWCAPCRIELPVLDRYVRSHPGADLQVFAVATERSVPNSYLKPLAAIASFPLILSVSGRGYGTKRGAVPTNYVIDRDGVIRHAEAGALTMKFLEEVVTPLLAAPSPAVTQMQASR